MFPWLLFGLIAVPLVVIAFVASRRRTVAGEDRETESPQEREELEREFAAADAYQEKWHEQDKEQYRKERLP
jgi:hypothetical protein